MIDRPQPIEFTLVAEDKRLAVAAKLFANYFVTFESTVYAFADRLSKDYNGAYWQFYTLSNGGFPWPRPVITRSMSELRTAFRAN